MASFFLGIVIGVMLACYWESQERGRAASPPASTPAEGITSPGTGVPATAGQAVTTTRSPGVVWTDLDPEDREAIEVIRVAPKDRPLWESKGWKQSGQQLLGFYETSGHAVRGLVDRIDSPRPDFYVFDPPPELRQHRHWICFRQVREGVFWIHFRPAPANADEGILTVERLLADAFHGGLTCERN